MRIIFVAVLLLTWGCGADRPHEIESADIWSESSDVPRRFASVSYDTVWTYGSVNDTVLQLPGLLIPAPRGGVFVFDLADVRVAHIDQAGEVAWIRGRRGQGPGEFMDVRAMSRDRDGGLVLTDHQNGRLVRLSADGDLVAEVPLSIEATYVDGIATLPSGYALYTNTDPPLLTVDEDGVEATRLPYPSEEWERMDWAQRTGDAVPWRDGAWVLGFDVGNGWYVIRGDSIAAYPYVEHTSFPVMTVTEVTEGNTTTTTQRLPRMPGSGLNLSVRGDTLAVFFEGETDDRNRTLDLYDLATGTYLHSISTPRALSVILADDGTLYVLSRSGGLFATLRALTRRENQP